MEFFFSDRVGIGLSTPLELVEIILLRVRFQSRAPSELVGILLLKVGIGSRAPSELLGSLVLGVGTGIRTPSELAVDKPCDRVLILDMITYG